MKRLLEEFKLLLGTIDTRVLAAVLLATYFVVVTVVLLFILIAVGNLSSHPSEWLVQFLKGI